MWHDKNTYAVYQYYPIMISNHKLQKILGPASSTQIKNQLSDVSWIVWKVSKYGVLLLRIFPYSEWIRRFTEQISVFSPIRGNMDQKKLRILTLFRQRLKHIKLTFHVPCINDQWSVQKLTDFRNSQWISNFLMLCRRYNLRKQNNKIFLWLSKAFYLSHSFNLFKLAGQRTLEEVTVFSLCKQLH